MSLSNRNITLSKNIHITEEYASRVYRLAGIVYHGGFHFTARIFDLQDQAWYHDGMTTKTKFIHEGPREQVNIFEAEDRRTAALALYI
ncbi:hypothetical protein FA95DRAFT_1502624 [Auriscalpium vulgare]|uniref:Uncharacterized protein n=1 Tax=Auriscalpium vulgare TaxID=40419 RepID=A0ACB8R9A2_9AGAM|nr:hypothetical protein FA95DRAFT_1502624 [Auriscalpium vulgare]